MNGQKIDAGLVTLLNRIVIVIIICFLCSCGIKENEEVDNKNDNNKSDTSENIHKSEKSEDADSVNVKKVSYFLEAVDEGEIFFYSSEGFYRYGPSIMTNDDGSLDIWLSAPGNSGSQWDWIAYRHFNCESWSSEEIVLRPTSGSKDRCSVCDPALVYFGGYYYLGYTATDYYEGKGTYNMAYVARSRYPDGPYEKWNGNGWGGNPEPIIFYDGGQDNWGIGEISFVVYDGDLCIFYTYIDIADRYVGLYKADLVEDWPGTMRNKGPVLYRLDQDSTEVVYDDYLNTFMAFTIENRMMEGSEVAMYVSENGKDFEKAASVKEGIEDYAHNMGVAKNAEGHVNTENELLIGYAYGPNWGRWNTKLQNIKVEKASE